MRNIFMVVYLETSQQLSCATVKYRSHTTVDRGTQTYIHTHIQAAGDSSVLLVGVRFVRIIK